MTNIFLPVRTASLGIDSMTLESTEVHMEFSEHFPLHHQPVLSAEELMESMAERGQRMLRAGCLGLGFFFEAPRNGTYLAKSIEFPHSVGQIMTTSWDLDGFGGFLAIPGHLSEEQ